jgi:cytochrome c oxidase cbb3-type subunit I/II
MWKQFNPDGTLTYGNFLETVTQIMPMYWMRAIGGTFIPYRNVCFSYNILKQ